MRRILGIGLSDRSTARRDRVAAPSPVRVNLGHPAMSDRCPDCPRKRTSAPRHGMLHECHERTSEMVRPGSMNELGTSSAEIIHRLHFVSTELADEAYAPRSAPHWRVQSYSPCERRRDWHP